MRRITIAAMVLIVGVALIVGLKPMTPARTADDYAHKAKDTAESALSAVNTSRLAAQVGSDGDAFGPYVSVVMSESETAVTRAQGSFDRVQPPDRRSDATRDRLGQILTRANDAISRLRITARRSELERLQREARPLRQIAHELRNFIEDPGPR